MRPWGHGLVRKDWIKAKPSIMTAKLGKWFKSRIPPLPPLLLNRISIPLGCRCGCCNIQFTLAIYCPVQTCDLRQKESSLQALLLGGSVWSLGCCEVYVQFDVPWPSQMGDIVASPRLQSSIIWVKGTCGFYYSVRWVCFSNPPWSTYLMLLLFPFRASLCPLISSAYR